MRQKNEKNQNVGAVPTCLKAIGVSWPTIASAIHIVIMQIAMALPLILLGNISEVTTNFNGPMENAKLARKSKTHTISHMEEVNWK